MSSPGSPEPELAGWPEATAEDRAALREARATRVDDLGAWLDLLARLELPAPGERRTPDAAAEPFRL